MTIISVSMDDKLPEEFYTLQEELGFSGRSEVIRIGARMLIADCKEKKRLEERLNAVLLLTHAQHVEDAVTAIKHDTSLRISSIHRSTTICERTSALKFSFRRAMRRG